MATNKAPAVQVPKAGGISPFPSADQLHGSRDMGTIKQCQRQDGHGQKGASMPMKPMTGGMKGY